MELCAATPTWAAAGTTGAALAIPIEAVATRAAAPRNLRNVIVLFSGLSNAPVITEHRYPGSYGSRLLQSAGSPEQRWSSITRQRVTHN
jgi:hypothetical protein